MQARILRVPVVVCAALCLAEAVAGTALAAPSQGGVVVSEGAACRVFLTKVSYDDPGADDAEFLELYAQRTSDGGASADAGSSPTDGGAGLAPLTLGDCGLGTLELVNGGGGACDTYRTLPLSSLAVPEDGYVTFCATDSVLVGLACDVRSAGRSALKNGWLQNGPSDGLRFIDRNGAVALELAYEGGPTCFGPNALRLVDETGQSPSASEPTDDVNAFCGDGFVLLSAGDASLRGAPRCPVALTPGARGDAAAPAEASGLDAGPNERPWTGERAPATAPSGHSPGYGSLHVDAGVVAIENPPSVPPKPPGCSTVQLGAAGWGRPCALALALVLVLVLTRRGRRA